MKSFPGHVDVITEWESLNCKPLRVVCSCENDFRVDLTGWNTGASKSIICERCKAEYLLTFKGFEMRRIK